MPWPALMQSYDSPEDTGMTLWQAMYQRRVIAMPKQDPAQANGLLIAPEPQPRSFQALLQQSWGTRSGCPGRGRTQVPGPHSNL